MGGGSAAGEFATRIRFAGISFGGSVEKNIGTGPTDVERSCVVEP